MRAPALRRTAAPAVFVLFIESTCLNQAERERTPGCDDDPAQVHRAWNGDDEDDEVEVRRRRRPEGTEALQRRPWNEAGEAADELEEEGQADERAQTEGMRADEERWLRMRARQR